jgi:iron complex outermembrane receptor protein
MVLQFSSAFYAFADSLDKRDTLVVIGRNDFNHSIDSLPANVSVITSEDIAQSGARSLATLLRGRAGIQVSDTNSGPVFSLRGFTGDQAAHNTLILVDGRRINKQDLSAPELNSILIDQIERIEILSGSAGVLYGDQAVGGVINIITKQNQSDDRHVSLSAGSFDSYAGSASLSQHLNDQWRFLLNASRDNSDNYRKHNRRETDAVLSRLNFADLRQKFFIEFSFYDNEYMYAGSLTEAQYKADPRQESSNTFSIGMNREISRVVRAGYEYNLDDDWKIKTNIDHNKTSSAGWLGSSTTDIHSTESTGTIKTEKQFVTKHGIGNILLGFDGADRDYHTLFNDRANQQRVSSFYSQLNYPLLQSLVMTMGGRYSHVGDKIYDSDTYSTREKLTNHQDAYELAFNYHLNDAHRFYLRSETNFRFAKVDEQAYTSPGVKGLKPQKGRSLEAGWSFHQPEYHVNLNVYNLRLRDEIVYDSSATTPAGGAFPGANVNADASKRSGWSLSSEGHITDDFIIGGEYHHIDAKFTEGNNNGKYLSWVARHTGRIYATYDISPNWQFYTEGVYTGSRYRDGDNSNSLTRLSAYWLGNVALNFQHNVWSAGLRVDNIFDRQYPANANNFGAFYPGDGRKLVLTGTYHF